MWGAAFKSFIMCHPEGGPVAKLKNFCPPHFTGHTCKCEQIPLLSCPQIPKPPGPPISDLPSFPVRLDPGHPVWRLGMVLL